ncbi:MAG: diacylglycerol kinase family protein [Candidatus Gracilibacteria bacterium]|nr:diacylglycerol kinase family protein [Candidatus Gracilibacteria bacterium]
MFYFIINPVAGTGKFPELEMKFREYLEQFGIEGEFAKTISSGDGMHLARVGLKKGYDKIVCVGGDGTVNELVNGIAGSDVLLGIIPFGKENTIAKALGIPSNWKDAVKVLLSEEKRFFRLGLLGERLFVGVVGIGNKSLKQEKTVLGRKDATEIEAYQVTLKVDDSLHLNSNILNVSMVNANWRSSNVFSPLRFNPQDDKLEIMINSLGEGEDPFSYLRASKIEISSQELLPVHIDYDGVRMQTPFTVEMSDLKQYFMVA